MNFFSNQRTNAALAVAAVAVVATRGDACFRFHHQESSSQRCETWRTEASTCNIILRWYECRSTTKKSIKLFYVSTEDARENDWDNVVTCHLGQSVARTWRLQNKCIGKHKLKPQYAPATAAATVVEFVDFWVGCCYGLWIDCSCESLWEFCSDWLLIWSCGNIQHSVGLT